MFCTLDHSPPSGRKFTSAMPENKTLPPESLLTIVYLYLVLPYRLSKLQFFEQDYVFANEKLGAPQYDPLTLVYVFITKQIQVVLCDTPLKLNRF